jgi:Tfp pilus assembly protein PilF
MRMESSKQTARVRLGSWVLLRSWIWLGIAVMAAGLLTGCFKGPEEAKKEYLEKGNDYFEKGKFSEASLMYQKALQKDRRYAEAWYRFSLLQLRQQQFTEAVSSLRKVVEIQPNHPDANGKLMDIYAAAWATDRRNRDAILTELEAVVAGLRKVNPGGFDTLRGESVLAMIGRKPEVSVQKLQQALQIQPKRLDAAQGYAQALVAVGKPAEAEAFAKRFVEENKQAAPMYDLLIAFAAGRKDLGEIERLMQARWRIYRCRCSTGWVWRGCTRRSSCRTR